MKNSKKSEMKEIVYKYLINKIELADAADDIYGMGLADELEEYMETLTEPQQDRLHELGVAVGIY